MSSGPEVSDVESVLGDGHEDEVGVAQAMPEPFRVPGSQALASTLLGLTGAVAVLGVTAITVVALTLAAPAYRPSGSALVNDTASLLVEPGDRLALIGWVAFAAVLGCVVAWAASRRRRERAWRLTRLIDQVSLGVGVVAGVLCVLAIAWGDDLTGLWAGVTVSELVTGAILACGVVWLAASRRRPVPAVAVAVIAVLGAIAAPAWFQVPGAVRDGWHIRYTVDELSAVAAGHFPLSDYTPQYTGVLPFGVAPALHIAPHHAPVIVFGYILLLQLVAVGVAVSLPALLGGRRFIAPALAVVISPLLARIATGTAASTYFAGMPLRFVLPACTILVAYLVMRGGEPIVLRRPLPWLGLGLVASLTALNNADHGLPAFLVVVVAAVATSHRFADATRRVAVLLVAASVVFGGYGLLGTVTGHHVHWDQWTTFQRIFGAEGFVNVAMSRFGLHIAIVSLFVAAAAAGLAMIWRSVRRGRRGFAYRQGLLMALTGGWSLLCTPYLSGRSLPAVYVGGYAFMIGLVVASMLPLLPLAIRAVRTGWAPVAGSVGVAMLVLAIVGCMSVLDRAGDPSAFIDRTMAAAPKGNLPDMVSQQNSLATVEPLGGGLDLRRVAAAGEVVQALPQSSLVALMTGIPSASVSSSPEYIELSTWFSTQQCSRPWPDGAKYLLVRGASADALAKDPTCDGYVDTHERTVYGPPGVLRSQLNLQEAWVLLPRATPDS